MTGLVQNLCSWHAVRWLLASNPVSEILESFPNKWFTNPFADERTVHQKAAKLSRRNVRWMITVHVNLPMQIFVQKGQIFAKEDARTIVQGVLSLFRENSRVHARGVKAQNASPGNIDNSRFAQIVPMKITTWLEGVAFWTQIAFRKLKS